MLRNVLKGHICILNASDECVFMSVVSGLDADVHLMDEGFAVVVYGSFLQKITITELLQFWSPIYFKYGRGHHMLDNRMQCSWNDHFQNYTPKWQPRFNIISCIRTYGALYLHLTRRFLEIGCISASIWTSKFFRKWDFWHVLWHL